MDNNGDGVVSVEGDDGGVDVRKDLVKDKKCHLTMAGRTNKER